MKITVSTVLAGLIFSQITSAIGILNATASLVEIYPVNVTQFNSSTLRTIDRMLYPVGNQTPLHPSSVFPTIEHPHRPVYADPQFNKVVPTTSWISNLFYPSVQNLAPTTPDPYILRLLDGFGGSPGLSISQPYSKVSSNKHTEVKERFITRLQSSNKVVGSYPAMNNIPPSPAGYIINGVVVDLRITSKEWRSQAPQPLVTSWDLFGARLKLSSSSGFVEFPIARGTPFITGIYHNLTPQFFTQHAIISVAADNQIGDVYNGRKFKISFNDNPTSTYLIYALGDAPLTLRKEGMSNLVADQVYNGPIQVAKLPDAQSESILDAHHGIWSTGGKIDTNSYR
jgi:endo-1,3(4)-beta-glucanase